MSIIGWRTVTFKEALEYDEYNKHRLDVKGGLFIMLMAKQKNRHNLNFDDWVDLDIKSVETRSL